MASPRPPSEPKSTSPARKKSSVGSKRGSLSRIFFPGRRQSTPRGKESLATAAATSNTHLINGSSDPMLPNRRSRDSSPTLLSVSTGGSTSATTSPIAVRKMHWRRRGPFFFAKSRQPAVTSVDMPTVVTTSVGSGGKFKSTMTSSGGGGSGLGSRLGVPRLTIRQPSIDEPPQSIEILDDDEVFNPYASADPVDPALMASSYSSVASGGSPLQQRAKKQDSGESRISSGYAGDAMTSSRDELDEVVDTPATGAPSSASSDGRRPPRFIWKRFHLNPSASSASSTDSAWKSLDSFTWRSVDGSEYHLRGTRLESLSEIERQALQKIAVVRLNKLLPGVNISKPKDSIALKQKRHKLIKSGRSQTVNIVDKKHGANEPKPVFGISLSECLQNDLRLESEQRCRSLDEPEGVGYLSVPRTRTSRSSTSSTKSACSEPGTIEADAKSSDSASSAPRPAVSADGRFVSVDNLPPAGMQLHKSASATSSTASSTTLPKQDSFEPHLPQVPKIVEIYTDYLRKHGLSTVGLFRVAGSAKRCRQMRVELDSGEVVLFDDDDPGDYQPHDIATLLKEYFRDLPDALLSKELYPAYLAAAKLNGEERVECIRLLLSLLASANSDTVLVLLKFLQNVASRSQDEYDDSGELIAVGNKMDAHNLATIFAPSILRPDHSKLQATLNESEAQIIIVETMIDSVDDIFAIPKDLQCQIFNKLREIEPDGLDKLLYQRSRYENAADDCSGPLESSSQVFTTTTEEDFPEEFRQNPDGSISIRTKTVTTHRTIVKHGSGPRVSPNPSRAGGPSPSPSPSPRYGPSPSPSPRPRPSPRFGRNAYGRGNSEQQFFGQSMTSAQGASATGIHQHLSASLPAAEQHFDDADRNDRQLISGTMPTTTMTSLAVTSSTAEGHSPPLAHIDDDETTIEPETSLAPKLHSTAANNNDVVRTKRHMKGKLAKMGGYVKDRFRAQS